MGFYTVDIKVSRALREYIVCTNGSDTLVPDKKSILWCLMKQHLDLAPNDANVASHITNVASPLVHIALRENHDMRTFNLNTGRVMSVNTLFRYVLNPTGEKAVVRHLMTEFKKTFRCYMYGALNNTDLSIADAIDEFCSDYHIEMEHITVEMLRKDWYRCRKLQEDEGKRQYFTLLTSQKISKI